jgi:DNA-binding MarR family transcriptional regulator
METEVAKSYFGALALAVARSIANASAAYSPDGPGAEAMVYLRFEPGLSIGVLANRIGLSHAGTVRLIDRLEKGQLVERRREKSDKRARFIHLTGAGERAMDALLKAREQLISNCLAPLSPDDLSILGVLSERILLADGFESGLGYPLSTKDGARAPRHGRGAHEVKAAQ